MTDKKLLELAAKASGLSLLHPDKDGDEYLLSYGKAWNPLIDDGDAQRLAVKFEMSVEHHHYTVSVAAYYDGMPAGFLSVEIGSCRYAATRRAIVRAAAAIGEKM